MDVRLSDEQTEIARQARRFFEKECPMDYVRAMAEDERGITEEVWKGMAEMGWMAMRLPEAYGGLGMEMMDMAVLMEEMGRAVLPGPFFSTVLLAAEIVMEGGSEEQKERYLSRIAQGELRGTLALLEPVSGADLDYVRMSAEPNGDGFLVYGTKMFVPDLLGADFVILAARIDDGRDPGRAITLFLVDLNRDGVSVSPLPTMDATRKLGVLELDGVRVGLNEMLGEPHLGWVALRAALQRGQVALGAECVGGAERVMEMAADYAKIRVQFDQPIGAYQAVKHRCAKMFQDVESARSLMYWSAWAQDNADTGEAALAASSAKAYCSEVFREVSASAMQVLGGTGFSWEHDIHFYLKRAKANEVALGDPIYHREQIALILGG
jgi:alkylation response protein AidB-like acyl-CoA dehydrogenase